MCQGTLTIIAHSWKKKSDGRWERCLYRFCDDCRQTHQDELIYVNLQYGFCMACLSQSVGVERVGDRVHIQCHDCHERSSWPLEEEEEYEEYTEEYEEDDPPWR